MNLSFIPFQHIAQAFPTRPSLVVLGCKFSLAVLDALAVFVKFTISSQEMPAANIFAVQALEKEGGGGIVVFFFEKAVGILFCKRKEGGKYLDV